MSAKTTEQAASLGQPPRDKPWLFRTYAGHSTAEKSNALYRLNLAKGQTGLSIAFDLPTQTGYDSDDPLAKGEVGKVGVPVSHIGDMRALLDAIPLGEMNTSMTINATAAWLLALYIALADERGTPRSALTGTIQNDIIKEYLSRGTYVFPPEPSLRLIKDTITFSWVEAPKWNPTNVCSYHLQEAGATPVQELAYALATGIAVLDAVKASGEVKPADFGQVFGRVSFFVNAGMRFVTEMCKMRAFVDLWAEIGRERYGVTDPKHLMFRYGVQVNSLGLTEQQAENNPYRILLEMLAVTLSKRARDAGMDVVYEGIRLTPSQIVRAALDESVHVVGLSILSGSHIALVTEVMTRMREAGIGDIPVVVGGIIPPDDARQLKAAGVAAVYTPKDFQLNDIMADIARLAGETAEAA